MKKKNILGLDLGTNSIGWAWLQQDDTEQTIQTEYLLQNNPTIRMSGSRIIPTSGDVINDFEAGKAVSKTKDRTTFRMTRRMNERFKLRRERLNRVLRILGMLPAHYAQHVDRYGKPDEEKQPKIAWEVAPDGKSNFLFHQSFLEMVKLFGVHQPQLQRIPLDWTLYYLRHKALTQPISKAELAWILHSFNQKRGYNQTRDELTEVNEKEKLEYTNSKVVSVKLIEQKKSPLYLVTFENGVAVETSKVDAPQWVGQMRYAIITTKLNDLGQPLHKKDGSIDQKVSLPNDDDWALNKLRTETQIDQSHTTVGNYIFQTLLKNPETKIKGAHVCTIDRRFYEDELNAILLKQAEFHPELTNRNLYEACLMALYANNEAHRYNLATQNTCNLITKDIIFYQRPLKSKKSLIAECPFEKRIFCDVEGNVQMQGIKCIPVSHPHFQEYRLWQFLNNLRIFQREVVEDGKFTMNVDVTDKYINENSLTLLFEWLQDKVTIKQKELLAKLRLKESDFRWNYVEDKAYPCGETRHVLASRLKKLKGITNDFLAQPSLNGKTTVECELWHILYSVTNLAELRKALYTFARKHNFSVVDAEAFVKVFIACPPFKKDYGAYSDKAICKLLSVMRVGKYWSAENIDSTTLLRIEHLITGEEDEHINERTRKHITEKGLQQSVNQYQGLQQWLACYVVYGRHAEVAEIVRWESPTELEQYINNFKQYSLRNPIVEQVSLETLRVVRDLWQTVAKEGGRIDEIHLEMGRDLKNSAAERAKISNRNKQNEGTNFRIKLLLQEFSQYEKDIEGIRPFSPSQQELLRIYEEGVCEQTEMPKDIAKIRRELSSSSEKDVKRSDIQRYRLWLDQKYCSPYTGQPIPLARLFTTDYEIEHVIPRSKYFDDSYNNKVICEAAVNKAKSNRLGMAFIQESGGQIIPLGNGRNVQVLNESAYVEFINKTFKHNARKSSLMLADEITEEFCHRQLTDTRYIARFMMGVLSNIVRQNDNGVLESEAISKNLIVCNGKITDRVKQDWGLNDVWNHIVTPRFKRLNQITNSSDFGEWCNKEGKRYFQTRIPLELQKRVNKKRIDHRHHAMDAIAIACTTRSLVNYLNNQSAHTKAREDYRQRLCRTDGHGQTKRLLRAPWKDFAKDAESALQQIVVSFKQNTRILTHATNSYECFDAKAGKKIIKRQISQNHYAIRKPLHKDTVYGEVVLPSIKLISLNKALSNPRRIIDKQLRSKILELQQRDKLTKKQVCDFFKKTCANSTEWRNYDFAKVAVRVWSNDEEGSRMVSVRKAIDESFDMKQIEKVYDPIVRNILTRHLKACNGDSKIAFSPQGVEEMNQHIAELNNGNAHLPIYKVKLGESKGEKFAIGQKGCKATKFVVTAKDTNLFFAVYANEEGKRSYQSVDLRTAIELKKQGCPVAPETNEKGDKLLFILSPNSLVYMPTEEEMERGNIDVQNLNLNQIFKMVSSTGNECYFVPNTLSQVIFPNKEYESMNKVGTVKEWDGYSISESKNNKKFLSIKACCIPICIDRLGRIQLKK